MLVRFPRTVSLPETGPPTAAKERAEELVRRGAISPAEAVLRMRDQVANDAAAPAGSVAQVEQELRVRQAMAELDELIGLEKVKYVVRELRAFLSIQGQRRTHGLAAEPLVLHMIFRGNPGTGKTTVARILGRVFKEMGVLKEGHLIEVERADLVGEYIGHTAQKTREQLKKAEGGILFIDEAYALARGGQKDFGKEAIDTLVKAMEDMKDRLVLILAGYQMEMVRFLEANPGLRSRFPIHIEFPDFTLDELLDIADAMMSRRQYVFGPGARTRLRSILETKLIEGSSNAGNARLVRNMIEAAQRRHALRLVDREDLAREDLMTLIGDDLRP